MKEWLTCSKEIKTSNNLITVFEVKEKNLPETSTKEALTKAFIGDHIKTSLLHKATLRYGWNQVKKRLIEPSIPTSDTIKKGRFGEILTGLLLCDFLGYHIPVKKNQFAITANQSLPATDLLIVKLRGDTVIEISFIESKLRTKNDHGSAVMAYAQLKKDEINRFMAMSMFVLKRLEENDDPLQNEILKYIFEGENSGIVKTLGISLVYDKGAWQDRVIQTLCDHVPDNESNLFVVTTRISKLEGLLLEILKPHSLKLGEIDD